MNTIEITHVIKPNDIPNDLFALRKIYFYTKKDSEYYLGTDNNPIEISEINELTNLGKVIKLKESIFLEQDEALFFKTAESDVIKENYYHLVSANYQNGTNPRIKYSLVIE